MKYIYTLALTFMATVAVAQQQTISFETSEGFQLGTIYEQNDWDVTIANENVLQNQVISSEKASTGTYSFKNAYESSVNSVPFPILGASKTFETLMDYNDFTISYDVLVTAKLGSNFEFALFAIAPNDEYVPVGGIGLKNTGFFYTIKDVDYGIDDTQAEWIPNEWVNVKIEVNTTEIKYYINSELVKTYENFTEMNIAGINILHDNVAADAYYDNILITSGSLNTDSFSETSYSVYPNPAQSTVSITLPNNVEASEISIYTITGQEVLSTNNSQNIDISKLAIGTYLLKGTTTNGLTFTKKIIKN